MDESGNTKENLGLPKGTDDAEKLAAQIQSDFADGKELVVTVLKVQGPLFFLTCLGFLDAKQYLVECHPG